MNAPLDDMRRMPAMTTPLANERGSALVLAIGVLVVLAALAVIIVSIAVTEKKSEFASYTHSRAFYSADAAGEAGVNWVRMQPSPPAMVNAQKDVYVSGGFTALSADHTYKYDVRFVKKHFRPGWGLEYKDYEYTIDADGASVQQSEAAIEVSALRLYKEGY
jgi:Tfp pilus assembly protein PilX